MANWKVAPTQLFTNALIAAIKAGLPASSPVFDAVVPPNTETPYWMVSTIPGGETYGPPLTNPDADVEIVYQIDGVGNRRDLAQMTLDRALEIVLGRNTDGSFVAAIAPPAGWSVCDRIRDEGSGGVEPEGAPPSTLYTASQRIRLAVTPT